MVNGNDLLVHEEGCDDCLETKEKLEQGKITVKEAEELIWDCFCNVGSD